MQFLLPLPRLNMASPCKDTPENVSNENLEDLDMPETSDRLDELGDDEFAPLDFSVDFTEGPGTADIIKAIATRWSQYVWPCSSFPKVDLTQIWST